MFPERLNEKFIDFVNSLDIKEEKGDEDKIISLLINAVDKRGDDYGIAFSGGVDSSLLALISYKLGKKFTLYSVGFKNSEDLRYARELAEEMKWPIKVEIIEDIENIVEEVVKILKTDNVVKVEVGCVVYCVLQICKEDKLIGGLGSEEIFCGYDRLLGENINKNCLESLKGLWERDLERDYLIAKHFDKELLCPYLDEELVRYVMTIRGEDKAKDEIKKLILRKAALNYGLDEKYSFRKKRAAQYGSSVSKELKKLARKKGFKFRKDYLRSLL